MGSIARIEVTNGNPVAALQGFCARLLADGEISAVLAPRRLPVGGGTMPALVADPEQFRDVDPLAPSFRLNAARMLTRLTRGADEGGLVAALLRPCEVRAFIELCKLNQGSLENTLLVSLDCPGAFANADSARFPGNQGDTESLLGFLRAGGQGFFGGVKVARACRTCQHPTGAEADLSIGIFGQEPAKGLLLMANTPRGEGFMARLGLPEASDDGSRAKALQGLLEQRSAAQERLFAETTAATSDMTGLSTFLSACVNCYNCRTACPVCYCKECVFLTDVFEHKPWQYMSWARQRGALKMPTDTVFFHLTRLAHMSTACVGCGQCSNACPNDVPVMELFKTIAASTQKAFEYEAGRDPAEAPPLSVFREHEFTELTGGPD
ncbi:MAG: 4Fe-4S dicluster domain-containing protein [Proteobacteria bacterium]|nr:4Fe-4S dicluster domain-containing protein [Pseudomonadota bacterium]MBU1594844.1 4Fe-4S dicluster domain-containing protein [Pseudomonadota bacterium]